MAAKKVGELIKEARTGAGLTQEKLGNAVGVTASEISKAERGELALTDAVLKKIAKATGVTQASLLNAPKGGSTAAKTTSAKTTAAKSSTAKTTTAKAAPAKSTAPKTPANADTSMKVTSTEKKLIELYRAASSDEKKAATKVLKGECGNLLTSIIGSSGKASNDMADLIGDAIGSLFGIK